MRNVTSGINKLKYQEDASRDSKAVNHIHHSVDTDHEKFHILENTLRISFRDTIEGAQLKQPPRKKPPKLTRKASNLTQPLCWSRYPCLTHSEQFATVRNLAQFTCSLFSYSPQFNINIPLRLSKITDVPHASYKYLPSQPP
jgi:hypothetical protein